MTLLGRFGCAALAVILLLPSFVAAQGTILAGQVLDPGGNPVPQAVVRLLDHNRTIARAKSNVHGEFHLVLSRAGTYSLRVEAEGFAPVVQELAVGSSVNPRLVARLTRLASRSDSVTVVADLNQSDVLSPDPAEKVFVDRDLLNANPGHAGAPVSIPGYPIETASSGIKAPQYFAPGVAGDHGEPIAQYVAVGSYLVPNNLSANAHGNGYADPNVFIPDVIESVQVDGGAFDVREGNHSVNLSATYSLRDSLDPFITVSGDARDMSVVAGLSRSASSWIALSGSLGNGFLHRLEHRQQYKANGERVFHAGDHRLTLLGIAYFGVSRIPGLMPILPADAGDTAVTNLGDTIDPRQKDQTHTAMVALNDEWRLDSKQTLQISGFFRTYNLTLYSDFGDGLIRQSEFRTVAGENFTYVNRLTDSFSFLAGFDSQREAPRRDDLDRYGFFDPNRPSYYGPFTPTDANNVTISPATAYAAIEGVFGRYVRIYGGWRRDEIDSDNRDLLEPQNSWHRWVGVNSPKATVSFLPSRFLPRVSLSYGEAFFTNDPRIGAGSIPPTPVNSAHSYQFVAAKKVFGTDFKLTLGHVTTSQTLAALDPDTGLQQDEGPGHLRFMTVALQRNLSNASLLVTFSKADARDLDTGQPTPEAPRTILDFLGALQKLPLHLQAKGEFEFIAAKPLGTGCLPHPLQECIGVPVREFRAGIDRPFLNGRMTVGINMLIANGYSGQTLETFAPSDISEVVGVRIPSYATGSVVYRFH